MSIVGNDAIRELKATARALATEYLPKSWNVIQYNECNVPTSSKCNFSKTKRKMR